jgi:hypothetical protein
MARLWYRAPARSFSLCCRCASSHAALVLTDLLANLESGKVNRLLRWLLKSIGGIAPPYGGVSRDLRLNFTWRHRHELEAAVHTMLSWARTAVGTTKTAPLSSATHLGGF